jgi:hypothetical protein
MQPGTLSAAVSAMTDGVGLTDPQTALIITFSISVRMPCESAA